MLRESICINFAFVDLCAAKVNPGGLISLPARLRCGKDCSMPERTYPVPHPISRKLFAEGKYLRKAQIIKRLRARNQKCFASYDANIEKFSDLKLELLLAN